MEEEKEILVPMCPNCCEGLKFIEMKPGVTWKCIFCAKKKPLS